MVSRKFIALFAALATLFIASSAWAQRKPRPACNIKALPFIEGTEWIYKAVAPPNPPKKPLPKPKQAAMVTIKIASVTTEGKETTIVLEEAADDRTYTTTLTCERDALFVPPQSFFFSGEPGGGLQLSLGEIERSEDSSPSYKFRFGRMVIPEWIENLKTTFTRTATEGTEVKMVGGTLDLQRIILIGLAEEISTELGTFDAVPLQVDLRGSVILDFEPEPKEYNIPANTLSKLWFAENVGVVQVYNTNGHLYQLAEVKTPEAEQK